MRKLRAAVRVLAAPALAALSLSACATPTAEPHGTASAGEPSPSARLGVISPYGQFLAGQEAADHGDHVAAADFFGRAADLDVGTDRPLLANRTFTSALLAGDVTAAAQSAPSGADADPSLKRLGALVRAVEALATNRPRQARAILTGPDSGAPNEPATALLTPFAAAAAGDVEGSIVLPVIRNEPIAQFFASLDQGKLFARARRYDEAETAFKALIGKGDPGGIASLNLGLMLERQGRVEAALAIYDQAIAAKKDSGEIGKARARAAAGRPPPAPPSLRSDAAEALIAPATALLIDKQDQIALAYLRLALRLDPAKDEGWMLVGDILTNSGEAAGARAAYQHVAAVSGQYLAARTKLAWSWRSSDDKAQALAVARETLAQRPADPDAAVTLADLLRSDERYDESAKILDGLIGADPDKADWKLLYMRAVDYEESDQWELAERDLKAALRQRPDEPELLNFLGYSWIDRGERLSEAMAMVRKAVDLQPQSGAMIDSLGWGYFRMGDYAEAVRQLEAAVALEPGDPDVNNHLGDAYWRAGRKVEAGYQWRRVLSLDPSAKLKTEVERKIANGLDALPAKPVVAAR